MPVTIQGFVAVLLPTLLLTPQPALPSSSLIPPPGPTSQPIRLPTAEISAVGTEVSSKETVVDALMFFKVDLNDPKTVMRFLAQMETSATWDEKLKRNGLPAPSPEQLATNRANLKTLYQGIGAVRLDCVYSVIPKELLPLLADAPTAADAAAARQRFEATHPREAARAAADHKAYFLDLKAFHDFVLTGQLSIHTQTQIEASQEAWILETKNNLLLLAGTLGVALAETAGELQNKVSARAPKEELEALVRQMGVYHRAGKIVSGSLMMPSSAIIFDPKVLSSAPPPSVAGAAITQNPRPIER